MEEKKMNQEPENSTTPATPTPNPPAPKKSKKFLRIGAAVLALILLVAAMGGGRTKVDMKDYIKVSVTGQNGRGTASMKVDYVSLAKVAKFTDSAKENDEDVSFLINVLGEKWAKVEWLEEGIQCTLENAEWLSNGDKVTVKITVDDDICKELNIKVKNQTLTYTVKGLT